MGVRTGGAQVVRRDLSPKVLIIKQKPRWVGKFSIIFRLRYSVCEQLNTGNLKY